MFIVMVKALLVSLATSLDELPVLFLLYNRHCQQRGKVTFSYFLGTFALIVIAGLTALGSTVFRNKASLGLIGLVPIVMGIFILLRGEDDETEETLARGRHWKRLFSQVFFITLAMGVDDLGVYIPLFLAQSWQVTLQMVIVFLVATGMLCYVAYSLTHIKPVSEFLERFERYIVSVVFVFIGVMVVLESGSIPWLLSLLK